MRNPDLGSLQLHERLLAGDFAASAELFEQHLTPVISQLSKLERFRWIAEQDPELIWDCVTDAIFAYIQEPRKYDPDKSSLRTYLRMSAQGDLLNALARQARRRQREQPLDADVELLPFHGNEDTEQPGERADQEADLWSRIAKLVPDEVEQTVVRLMIDGERSRDVFAEVLGVSHLPDTERNREVDRVKDRLKKRLQRAGRTELLDL